MSTDVFISYSRKDLAFIAQLYQELTQRGISAWFDRETIVAAHVWSTEIVEIIRACKVFLLILSPDSVAAAYVRQEMELAERYQKQILPLMWRATELPVAMEYQLAGLQYLDFKEAPTQEQFDGLALVLTRLLSGVSLAEAAADKPAFMWLTSPQPTRTESQRPNRLLRDRQLKKPQQSSIVVTAGKVIGKVITYLNEIWWTTENQDQAGVELKWLLSAADHVLNIQRAIVDRVAPIPMDIPPYAELNPGANNAVLASIDEDALALFAIEIEQTINLINIYLDNLTINLSTQIEKGEAAYSDIRLMNAIKDQQREIIGYTRDLAGLMQQIFGVRVYGPDQLLELLYQM